MSDKNAVIAVYESHSRAEEALRDLQATGYDIRRLSIVGRDYHTEDQVVGYYNAGDRMKRWGKAGAFWGGIWGLLIGSAYFAFPGIGPVLVAGPMVGWIVAGLEGVAVVGGLSAFGAGLYSIGIPKDSIVRYEAAIKSDRLLLVAHGAEQDVEVAKGVMARTHPAEVAVHSFEHRALAGLGGDRTEQNAGHNWLCS